jgi:hypothetical protein
MNNTKKIIIFFYDLLNNQLIFKYNIISKNKLIRNIQNHTFLILKFYIYKVYNSLFPRHLY